MSWGSFGEGFSQGFISTYEAFSKAKDRERARDLEIEAAKKKTEKEARDLQFAVNDRVTKANADIKKYNDDIAKAPNKKEMDSAIDAKNNLIMTMNNEYAALTKSQVPENVLKSYSAFNHAPSAKVKEYDVKTTKYDEATGQYITRKEYFPDTPEMASFIAKDSTFIGENGKLYEAGVNDDSTYDVANLAKTGKESIESFRFSLGDDAKSDLVRKFKSTSPEWREKNGIKTLNDYALWWEKNTGSSSGDKRVFTVSDLPKGSQQGYIDKGLKKDSQITKEVYNSEWKKDTSKGSGYKAVEFTEIDENGNRIGTIKATTPEKEKELRSQPDKYIEGTKDKPVVPTFEKKSEEAKDMASKQAKAIEIGKNMNKGEYKGEYSTEDLVLYENAAIERLNSEEKTTLATDENYQLLADEFNDFSSKISALRSEGKLNTGILKTSLVKAGRFFPKEIAKMSGMTTDEIIETLGLMGEGASANAELIKIISGLAATDKEFERQFSANIGSWFADPEVLDAEVKKTKNLLNKRVKARQAKWRSKGIIQRFETKAEQSKKDNNVEPAYKMNINVESFKDRIMKKRGQK